MDPITFTVELDIDAAASAKTEAVEAIRAEAAKVLADTIARAARLAG